MTSTSTTKNKNNIEHIPIWADHNYDDLKQIIDSAYEEIVFWNKNLFLLPSGAAGKKFITEMTRLIDTWNNSTHLMDIGLKNTNGYASFITSETKLQINSQTTL